MEQKLLMIGEMAELNHVSTQTLRLYDKYNLLKPEYLDPETGYRYYTIEQCVKLDLIHALKSCRLSLEKIRGIFELSSEELLLQVLEEQAARLTDEIHSLAMSRNNLNRIQRNLQVLHSLPPFGQVFFEYIQERKIDLQDTEFDFFSQGYSGYEKMLRHMQNYLHENHLPPSYFVNVGTMMEQEYFVKGAYRSQTAFIFVDDLYPPTDSIRILPQNMYMSVVSDRTSLEKQYAGKLYEEMEKNGMQPCGDYICEVLTQFSLRDYGELVYKIQVPVKKKDTR